MKKFLKKQRRKLAGILAICCLAGTIAGIPIPVTLAAENVPSTEIEQQTETQQTEEIEQQTETQQTEETEQKEESQTRPKRNAGMNVTAKAQNAESTDYTGDKDQLTLSLSDVKCTDGNDRELNYSKTDDYTYDVSGNSLEDVKKVFFTLNLNIVKDGDARAIKEGDCFYYTVPQGFSVSDSIKNKSDKTIKDQGVEIARYEVIEENGTQKIKFTFSKAVNSEMEYTNLHGGMNMQLDFDGKERENPNVVLFPKESGDGQHDITLKIPEAPKEIDGITKEGTYHSDNNTIDWTITVGTNSKGISLAGLKIEDTLGEGQTYLGFELKDSSGADFEGQVTVSLDGNKVTADINDDATIKAPATFVIKTAITQEKLKSAGDEGILTLYNTLAKLNSDNSKVEIGTNNEKKNTSVTVNLKPGMEKRGEAVDSHRIRWTITVNNKEPRIHTYRGAVTDKITPGLKVDTGSIKYNGNTANPTTTKDVNYTGANWPGNCYNYDEGSNTLIFYMEEDTQNEYTITFDTIVGDTFQEPEGGMVTNVATVSAQMPYWDGGQYGHFVYDYGTPEGKADFASASIKKTVQADARTGKLTWTIYPSTREQDWDTAVITDIIDSNRNVTKIPEDGHQKFNDDIKVCLKDDKELTEDTDYTLNVNKKDSEKPEIKIIFAKSQLDSKNISLDDIKIVYSTTAIEYFKENNIERGYVNEATLEVSKGGTSLQNVNDSNYTMLKNSFLSKGAEFMYDEDGVPYFHYTVRLNNTPMNLTDVEVRDAIENIDFGNEYLNEHKSEFWEFDTEKCTVDGSDEVNNKFTSTDDGQSVTISWSSLTTSKTLHLYVRLKDEKRKDEVLANLGDETIQTTNQIQAKSQEVQGDSDDRWITDISPKTDAGIMDNHILTKTGKANDLEISWNVVINPNGGTLAANSVITDTIGKEQKYVQDSVELHYAKFTEGSNKIEMGDPVGNSIGWKYDLETTLTERKLIVTLTEETNNAFVLTYKTDVVDNSQTSMTNQIALTGNGNKDYTSSETVKASGGSWGSLKSVGALKIIKTDAMSKDIRLSGVQFSVYADEECKDLVDIGETNEDGEVLFVGLTVPVGESSKDYYVKEKQALAGYVLDEEKHQVTVPRKASLSEAAILELSNERKQHNSDGSDEVIIKKIFNGSGDSFEGQSEFQLKFYPQGKEKAGVDVYFTGEDGIYTYTSNAQGATKSVKNNANGELKFEDLPWGVYGLSETSPAPGYAAYEGEKYFEVKHTLKDNNDSFDVAYSFDDSNPQNNEITNNPTTFYVKKYETNTTTYLPNIKLQIRNKDGQVVKDALHDNKYEWITDSAEANSGHTVEYLPAGDYYLHEVPSDGNLSYVLAEDIPFTVDKYGKVTYKDQSESNKARNEIVMYNSPIELKIAKVDQFGLPVAGATLQMKDKSDNLIETHTTTIGDMGNVLSFKNLQRNGNYTLIETECTDDYKKIDSITVEVSEDGKSFNFVAESGSKPEFKNGAFHVVDEHLVVQIEIQKKDALTGKTLGGAKFELYGPDAPDSKNMKKYCDIETGEDGKWSITSLEDTKTNPLNPNIELKEGLKQGDYYLKEIEAPAGYILPDENNKIEFTITDKYEIELKNAPNTELNERTFTIYDMPLTLRIQPLEFENGYDKGLGNKDLNDKGASYEVTGTFLDETGKPQDNITIPLTGTKNGAYQQQNALTARLIPDKVYKIEETKAPDGYVAPDPVYVKLDNQGVVKLCDEMGAVSSDDNIYSKYSTVENALNVMDDVANGFSGLVKIYHGKTRAQLKKYTSWNSEEGKEETDKNNYKPFKATFTLTASEGYHFADGSTKKTYTTNENGIHSLDGELVDGGKYTLHEEPNPGYKDLEDVTFTYDAKTGTIKIEQNTNANGIVTADTVDNMPTLTVVNQSEQNTNLQFLVYDCADGSGLAGVKFELTYDPGAGSEQKQTITTEKAGEVHVYTTADGEQTMTTSEGEAFVPDLQPGKYTLTQIEAPYGYQMSEQKITITFTVDANAKNKSIIINEENVKNQEFSLAATEFGPKVIGKGICNKRIDGSVYIKKIDYDNKKPLNGVEFTIFKYNEADSVFEKIKELFTGKSYEAVKSAEWNEQTAEDGVLKVTGLEWGKYRIAETKTLDHYFLDKDSYFDFEIGKDNLTQYLDWTPNSEDKDKAGIITNARIQVEIWQIDSQENAAESEGHKMRLIGKFANEEDNRIKTDPENSENYIEWDVTNEAYAIAGLLLQGETYTVEETTTLPGHVQANKFDFKYKDYGKIEASSEDGTVTVVEVNGIDRIVQQLKPLQIRIKKVDEQGKLLKGAKLSLSIKKAGTETVQEIASWTTDGTKSYEVSGKDTFGDNQIKIEVGDTCIIKETEAPTGYVLAEDIEFVVAGTTEWQEYTMTDKLAEPDDDKTDDDKKDDDKQDGDKKDDNKQDNDKKNDQSGNDGNSNGNQNNTNQQIVQKKLPKTGRELRSVYLVTGGILLLAGVVLSFGRRKKKQ